MVGDRTCSPGILGGEHPAGPHSLRGLEEGDGPRHQEDGAGHQGEGERDGQGLAAAEGVGWVERRPALACHRPSLRSEGPTDRPSQDHRVAAPKRLARSGKGKLILS